MTYWKNVHFSCLRREKVTAIPLEQTIIEQKRIVIIIIEALNFFSGPSQALQGRRPEAQVHGDHLDGVLEEQRGVRPGLGVQRALGPSLRK